MKRSRVSIIIGLGLSLIAHPASAQSPTPKPKAPLNNAAGRDNASAQTQTDRIAKVRRTQARLLLISLANEAYSFHDQTLRARSMARIADALWSVDTEQGRTLFRKAWETAETGDQESHEPLTLGQEPLNLRREVLTLVAKRDRLLAEEFLQKLSADQQKTDAEPSGNNAPTGNNLWRLPEAPEQRLSLAKEMLRTGDVKRALQLATPVLDNVTISTLEFLTDLREKDPVAADHHYAIMLANTGSNLLADANTISLLASYVFTPHLYVIFHGGGSDTSSTASSFPQSNVDPQLRLAFFQTASGLLLRPQPPPAQDQSTLGIVGKYLVIKRLMPLFEQYAPQELTAAMRGQFEALNSMVSDSDRQSDNEWIQKGISPEKSLADREQPLLDQIERAGMSTERDELYFQLALLALSKDDMKARDYVSKIEESGFRKQAQAWIDACLALSAIKNKKIEMALELARDGELAHIQRVWLLTQAAKLLAKTDRDKALSLCDDATIEARRIEIVDLDHPRGLLAVANALQVIEPARAWETTFDATKAANSTEGFTGEGGALTLHISSKTQNSSRTDSVPDFDIEGIFSKLANDDYDRAVQLARGFQGEASRTNATIAIALAILNQKRASTPAPQTATKK